MGLYKRIKAENIIYTITILLLFIFLIYPLGKIIGQAFLYNGGLSLKSILSMWTVESNQKAMIRSLNVAVWSTIFSLLLGIALAWIVTRTNLPHKKRFKSMLLAPFLIPPFVGAIAWVQLLGPAGYLNKLLMHVLVRDEPLFYIYGAIGIIIVMTLHSYPTTFLVACTAFEKMDSSLEEAALMSGGTKKDIIKDITLPIMMPSILGVALITFVQCITNFGVPAVLGMPSRYLVFTTKIYEQINSFGNVNNFSFAAALSVQLIAISLTALLLQKLYLGKKQYTVITGKSTQPQVLDMGKLQYAFVGLIVLIFIITTIAPITAIILSSLNKAVGLTPTPANWTLKNYEYVLLKSQTTIRAIKNSLFLGLISATGATLLGGLVSYFSVKSKMRGRQAVEFIGSTAQAVPGTVLGLGMILAWIKPVAGISIYNTIWIIALAYIAHYISMSIRTTSASFYQIHDSLEEAARMSGATWLQTIRDIVFPMIRTGLIASWMLVFMPSLRELTISILLWSSGNETIGVSVFNLSEGGQTQYASAMGVVLIVIVFLGNLAVKKVTKNKYGF